MLKVKKTNPETREQFLARHEWLWHIPLSGGGCAINYKLLDEVLDEWEGK